MAEGSDHCSRVTPACLPGPAGGWSATLPEPCASSLGLDSNTVIHGRCDPLGTAEVTLGGLHGNVPEEELNLLQLASGGAAEPGATSTEIVRRQLADADVAAK